LANNGSEHANIEKMVRRLGERIDAALEPGANRRDIEQLEQQIELVSKKLDRLADSGANAENRATAGTAQSRQAVARNLRSS